MIKIKKICIVLILIIALVTTYVLYFKNENKKELKNENKFNIVTTFYPVDLIVKNLTKGIEDVQVINITKSMNGCVHDYQLTPSDLREIEKSDVVVINGADMEHFIENIENIKMIDSSRNIKNEGVSSHIWMNIDNYINQIDNITNDLCTLNSKNKDEYMNNKNKYMEKVLSLKKKYDELEISDTNIAIMHDSLKYYANDNKFNISAELLSGHEENVSANQIKDFINEIKSTNTKVLMVDSETNSENIDLINNITNETNVKVVVIDLIVENSSDLDNYINKMENNIERIKEAVNNG